MGLEFLNIPYFKDKQTQERMMVTSFGCYFMAALLGGTITGVSFITGFMATLLIWFPLDSWPWLVVRTFHLLGIWTGMRVLIQSKDRKDIKVLVLGFGSIISIVLIILMSWLAPTISR